MRSIQLHMDSRRFVPAFLLGSLVAVLPADDPGAAVEKAKAQAVATVRALLPAAAATAETVDAGAGFIADFPHPLRVLDVGVSAAAPVTLAAMGVAAGDAAQAAALLKTLTVTATYAGEAH